jgi:hypothetical protein
MHIIGSDENEVSVLSLNTETNMAGRSANQFFIFKLQ